MLSWIAKLLRREGRQIPEGEPLERAPQLAGWRRSNTAVGEHLPPDFFRVPVLLREYCLDLQGRLAYGWRQEALARNGQEVADLGKQLYERVAKFGEHCANVGDKLGKAVDAYNSATSTLESRGLVCARRLRDMKAAPEGAEVEVIGPIERTARVLQAPVLSSIPSDGSEQ